jgi:hypothetical protein
MIVGGLMDNTRLSDLEIQRIVSKVKNRFIAEIMLAEHIEGRTITVVNDDINKVSGGIMISKKDATGDDYLGEYFNLEEFLTALDEFLESENEKESSPFERKGKLELDEEGLDDALVEFTSLFVEKQQSKNAGFYGVSRSDENSKEVQQSGGVILPNGVEAKEGQYVDESTIDAIFDSIIEVPTEEEIKDAVEKVKDQSEEKTEITRKKEDKPVMDKVKEYGKRIGGIVGITIALFIARPYIIDDPTVLPPYEPNRIEQREDELAEMFEEGNRDLEIGDVVELEDGVKYDHNSQADDGLSGVIGENDEREAGEYTVDVISIHDEDGKVIAFTADKDGNLEQLLEENGYSMEDIENGKIKARYNVSEGRNEDLDRSEAAGWIDYDKDTYKDIGNVIHDNELGGKSI